jgi:hypothetical protein
MESFPVQLGDMIESVGRGSQELKLPRSQIRLFELTGVDSLREWLP